MCGPCSRIHNNDLVGYSTQGKLKVEMRPSSSRAGITTASKLSLGAFMEYSLRPDFAT